MRIMIMMRCEELNIEVREANGVEPNMKDMNSGKDQADTIAYHINIQGDYDILPHVIASRRPTSLFHE
ncbi:hypothetical protein SAMN04488587_1183 [Methanococcoides vulcani]|uniref:Uncharacterized protein n=1 Tax=Methanococcoides vulcani TaxID=1353158 RepID=A0A1H9ZSI1_9EURY|nr:hypothetical protein SAMN04488587_1183 [Methanococcoides vulcani]